MKEHIEELLIQALLHLIRDGVLNADCDIVPQLERTRSPEHGEFASNIAMVLAKRAGRPPRELAQALIDKLPGSRQMDRAEIAGPGFINFHMNRVALTGVVNDILYHGEKYTSGKLFPLLDKLLSYDVTFYLEGHDPQPASRSAFRDMAKRMKTIGQTVERIGRNREKIIATLTATSGQTPDEDSLYLVDTFLNGLAE